MKTTYSLTGTKLEYDWDNWWAGRVKMWKVKRWYFQRIGITSVKGKPPLVFRVGPITIKWQLEVTHG